MLHQPDPEAQPDVMAGILAIRHMHMRSMEETGLTLLMKCFIRQLALSFRLALLCGHWRPFCGESGASPYGQRPGYSCWNEESHQR